MKKITVAIIGLGRIGFDYGKNKNLSHFNSILDYPNFKITSLVDKNLSIKKKLQNNFKEIFYEKIKLIPVKKNIDIAIISSSDDSHYKNTIDIIKYKPKLIIIEKPISKKYQEIKKICNLLEKNKINMIVNFSRRFNKDYISIKKKIQKGFFGKIKYVRMHYSRGLIHNSVHLLELSIWLFGKPLNYSFNNKQRSRSLPQDWSADIILNYSSFSVYILSCDIHKLGNEEIDIIGDKKRVLIDCEMNIRYYLIRSSTKFKNTKFFYNFKSSKINYDKNLKNLYTESMRQIQKKKFNFNETLKNSLYIHKLIEKNF